MGMKYIIYEITPLEKSILYSYIGSTKNFRTRKCDHKNNCYNENNTKKFNLPVYKFIRENGGWDAFEMNPIEEIEVENKTQARIREQFWKEDRETKFQVLNAINPYSGLIHRTEYLKNYYQENREQIRKLQKNYQKENNEKINEYKKHYRDENKQKANEKHTCFCGGKYTTQNKSTHLNSLKHQAYVQACLTPTTL